MGKEKSQKKNILFWSVVVFIGIISGLLGSQLFFWLGSLPAFEKIAWLCKSKDATTIINKTEKIYLTEDLVYQDSISRVLNSVVYLRAEKAGKVLADSVGFVLTSDGLAATVDLAATKGATSFVLVREEKEYPAQLVKEDKINNLAIFKIAENNLSVVSFGEIANLKLGERVFFPGIDLINKASSKFVLAGWVKALAPAILFSLEEKLSLSGEPIINSRGEVLGLALADKEGNAKLVEAEKIRELMK